MTPQQRSVAEKLARWHQAMADEPNRNGAKKEKHAITAALLRELAAEPQGEPEPVAWMDKYPIGGVRLTDAAYTLLHGAPLYAHPTPRPLTDEQIVEALAGAGCCGKVSLAYDSGPYEITSPTRAAITLVRAIEAAHGIKEQK